MNLEAAILKTLSGVTERFRRGKRSLPARFYWDPEFRSEIFYTLGRYTNFDHFEPPDLDEGVNGHGVTTDMLAVVLYLKFHGAIVVTDVERALDRLEEAGKIRLKSRRGREYWAMRKPSVAKERSSEPAPCNRSLRDGAPDGYHEKPYPKELLFKAFNIVRRAKAPTSGNVRLSGLKNPDDKWKRDALRQVYGCRRVVGPGGQGLYWVLTSEVKKCKLPLDPGTCPGATETARQSAKA